MGLYDWLGFSNCVGLYLLRYNQTLRSLYLDEIKLTASSPTPHSYWGRRASFSPAGVNNITPYVNVCFVGFWNGQMVKVKPFSLAFGATTPVSFYGYSTVASWYIPNTHTHTHSLSPHNKYRQFVGFLFSCLVVCYPSIIDKWFERTLFSECIISSFDGFRSPNSYTTTPNVPKPQNGSIVFFIGH
jgi:hypothetical protein